MRYSKCTYDLILIFVTSLIIYKVSQTHLIPQLILITSWIHWKGSNTMLLLILLVLGKGHLNKISEELGWESLNDCSWCRCLFHFYKIHNSLTPPYLNAPIPPIRTHLFGSRSENILNEIRCKSKSYSNTYYLIALDVAIK